ncbi:MAG: DUF1761 domain-containing protein [Gammaproteobacteria bacterium]|nr:DUF1761 domain-containing protein [Gammaproteobacteria bacterium]
MEINLLAALAAAVSAFLLGGIWYSPFAFGTAWQREAGVDIADSNPALIFGGSFVLALIAALVFAMFLGPRPSLALGVGAGFAAGSCWVAASFGISYLFARRSLKLFLIDGGYHTLQFTLYGLILALWH